MKTARLPLPAITSAHVRALAVTTVVVLTLAVATSMASAVASSVPIVNPSMESGWTAAGPAGWQMGVVGAGSATVTSSSSAHSGAYSARLTVSSLAASANRKIVIDQKSVTSAPRVIAGHHYFLSAWYRASISSLMTVYYHDTSGWHYWAQSGRFASRTTWGAMTYTTGAVPKGADALSFGATVTSLGWLRFDDAAITDTSSTATPSPSPAPTASPTPTPTASPAPTGAVVEVSTSAQLASALAAAEPGQTVHLANATYTGNFTLKRSGTASAPIRVTGSRQAVLNGGTLSSGYVLHLDNANYIQVDGISVTNGQKGVVLDQSSHVTLTGMDLHTTGSEIVLLRNYSSDNVVSNNEIHDSGRVTPGYGEGVYVGLSVSDWSSTGQSRTNGGPDTSDRDVISGNHIYSTTAENVDIKEGTTGGVISGNQFDATGMTGANYADSWVDIAGNGYTVQNNTGINPGSALLDGYQTHIIMNGWANDNVFRGNSSAVSAPGFGINIQTPSTGNAVYSTNTVSGASKGLTNVNVTP